MTPRSRTIESASRPRFGRLRPKKQTSATGVSQLWGGNSLAANQCQRWLELFTVFGRDAVQALGLAVRWRASVGAGARAGTRPARKGI